jgi:hypothetical protein
MVLNAPSQLSAKQITELGIDIEVGRQIDVSLEYPKYLPLISDMGRTDWETTATNVGELAKQSVWTEGSFFGEAEEERRLIDRWCRWSKTKKLAYL